MNKLKNITPPRVSSLLHRRYQKSPPLHGCCVGIGLDAIGLHHQVVHGFHVRYKAITLVHKFCFLGETDGSIDARFPAIKELLEVQVQILQSKMNPNSVAAAWAPLTTMDDK